MPQAFAVVLPYSHVVEPHCGLNKSLPLPDPQPALAFSILFAPAAAARPRSKSVPQATSSTAVETTASAITSD